MSASEQCESGEPSASVCCDTQVLQLCLSLLLSAKTSPKAPEEPTSTPQQQLQCDRRCLSFLPEHSHVQLRHFGKTQKETGQLNGIIQIKHHTLNLC